MRYTATFKDRESGATRTLPIQAEDRNEAVRIAKKLRRGQEAITDLRFDASSVFDNILNQYQVL